MSELPRRIVSRLRRFFGNRRRTKRARVRLDFSLSLTDPRVGSNGSRRSSSLKGHTLDISGDGIALVVPAIRIGDQYLVADNRSLYVKLELPDGPVELSVLPVRYESLEEDEEQTGYLIGGKITEIGEVDRGRFLEYVKTLLAQQSGN
jgi:hypothetical protein